MTKIAQMFENEKQEALRELEAKKDAEMAEKMAKKDAEITMKDDEIARLTALLEQKGITV